MARIEGYVAVPPACCVGSVRFGESFGGQGFGRLDFGPLRSFVVKTPLLPQFSFLLWSVGRRFTIIWAPFKGLLGYIGVRVYWTRKSNVKRAVRNLRQALATSLVMHASIVRAPQTSTELAIVQRDALKP